ncbi:hypothetical protein AX14_002400 [Amanita brunnescens Koide BX004]|nr:hypothetical protein AX14_002400 [Amanita brunnescens Koide BX004]
MTVYYTLTFLLLAAEMITFCLMVAPLPHAVRKTVFAFMSGSWIVAKIAYAVKIAFIFVGILFVDAIQRMYRITAEVQLARTSQPGDLRVESSLAARKFYAQRNTYLTGFCLFLSVVLLRTFYILLELVHAKDENVKLQKEVASRKGGKNQDAAKEVLELKKKIAELEAKDRDFETLKKQARQQDAEYNRLATEYNEATGSKSDKRKD